MNDAPLTDRDKIFRLIHTIGQAAFTRGIENSHSGNISIKYRDGHGDECIATGSQKGELKRCLPFL
jgi:hypothetical protein